MKILTIGITIVLTLHCVHAQSQNDPTSGINHLKKDSLVHNYENITRIEEILELFSVGVIGSRWTKIHKKLSTVCAENMMKYLNGLEQKEIWAIKSKLFKCVFCLSAGVNNSKREWTWTVTPDLYENFTFLSSRTKRSILTTCSATHWLSMNRSSQRIRFLKFEWFCFKTVSHYYIKV